MMRELWETMQAYQISNREDDGVSFTQEEFSKLYNLVGEASFQHAKDIKLATGKGVIIGAVGAGLIGLGIKGISKIRKDNLSINQEQETVQSLIEEVEVEKPSDKVKRPKDTKEIAEELLDSYRRRI